MIKACTLKNSLLALLITVFLFIMCLINIPIKTLNGIQFGIDEISTSWLQNVDRISIHQTNVVNEIKKSSILENLCKFPIIEPMEFNLHDYVHLFRDVLCDRIMPNLASLSFDEHKLIIHNELEAYRQAKVPSFSCTYQGMDGALYPNKTIINWISEEIEAKEDVETEIPYDQFVVRCRNTTVVAVTNGETLRNDSLIYERAFIGFSENKRKLFENRTNASPLEPSLAILVLDSVSRNQFLRHMPRSVDFMRKIGFDWLNGYTKIGDNSAVNLLPILAGLSILPQVGGDGSEIVANETIVNLEGTQFLWDIAKDRNCITLINDNIIASSRGLFHYPNEKFHGFRVKPADFYFRAYHLFNSRFMYYPMPSGGQCLKTGQMTSNEYLDIWEKFSTQFKNKCHFSFNFLTELTHDDSNYLGAIDDRLRTSLEHFLANEVLENTAFVIMGDHGNRIGGIQHSYVGRIEERAPFFALYLPEAYRKNFPEKWRNFQWNTNRLSSNFDIHQTLKGLLQPMSKNKSKGRGINLFENQIPEIRTCEEAGIPKNFCLCMETRNSSRFTRTSKEFVAIEELLLNYTRSQNCFEVDGVKIVQDQLQPLAINQMVRHGIRDEAGYEAKKHIQATLEIIYFDLNAIVDLRASRNSTSLQRLRLAFRVKHYLKEFTFQVTCSPLVLSSMGRSVGSLDNLICDRIAALTTVDNSENSEKNR